MKGIAGKIVGVVLFAGLLFGLFIVIVIPFEMTKKLNVESWPSRKGVITKSYIHQNRGSMGKLGSVPYWSAEVCGTYSDTRENFCVDRIRYGGFRWGGGKSSAEETVAKYGAGREVDIYYSPDDPKETVLEARTSWREMFVLLGIGIGFLVIPILLWIFRRVIEPERYGRT